MKPVLIIDDEESYRELISEILSDCGFPTICALDGAEGLEQLAAMRPALVLLDMMMPRMDGREFLQRMNELADEALRNTPVWVISATTPGRTASTSLANGFLLKTVELGAEVVALAERYCR